MNKNIGHFSLIMFLFAIMLFLPLEGEEKGRIRVLSEYLFEGSVISFDVDSNGGQNFTWDYGDGFVTKGGRRSTHIYNRPGTFTVKVYSKTDKQKPIAEKRIRITKEDRRIILPIDTVVVGSEATIKTENFIDKYIKWNLGDGTPDRRGGHQIVHTYRKTGTFKIKAVDFDGNGKKKIQKKMRVIKDDRVLEMADFVFVGEPVELNLRNGAGGDFVWEFSDGNKASGHKVKLLAFRRTGMVEVSIKDRSGKFPPFRKNLRVSIDNRSLETSLQLVLPGESVEFKVTNFKGKNVEWGLSGGVKKETSSKSITHSFKKVGRYKITASDFGGKSTKIFSQEIVVAELTPNFQLNQLELAFADGKYYRVVQKGVGSTDYYVKFKGQGRGILKGKWLLDNRIIGLFEILLKENQTETIDNQQVVKLPVIDHGLHEFSFVFTNYNNVTDIPLIKYFVTETGMIEIVSPTSGEKIVDQRSIKLAWKLKSWDVRQEPETSVKSKYQFDIAISKIPFQFLKENKIVWRRIGPTPEYILDIKSSVNWIYWQVRQKNQAGSVLTTSEIASFKVRN